MNPKRYRIAQCGTGNVGLRVYSEAKESRDAGELFGTAQARVALRRAPNTEPQQ